MYKYGIVIAGVLLAWRRRKLQRDLREKLETLRREAYKQGFAGKPDVIAHSFGTWLFGHLLMDELTIKHDERLKFGRVVLTGCILRPDFDWKKVQEAGVVENVLNHYGTKDAVVPWAHLAIFDSGPSGRRGFDGDGAINVIAAGYGHSDLFAVDKWFANGKSSQPSGGGDGRMSHLERSYNRYWRPFLTLPVQEMSGLPDLANPKSQWRPLPWPLRGTLFPLLVLPTLLLLILILTGFVGAAMWRNVDYMTSALVPFGVGLVAVVGIGISILALRRRS